MSHLGEINSKLWLSQAHLEENIKIILNEVEIKINNQYLSGVNREKKN